VSGDRWLTRKISGLSDSLEC